MPNIFATEDFVTEEKLRDGKVRVADDLIDHTRFANALLSRVADLPDGSVTAIQGPWGRGKTDVLARVALATYGDKPTAGIAREAFWLNPWEYGTSDLLTPMVLAILQRLPKTFLPGNKALKRAVQTVIQGGLNFGMKAGSTLLPGGALWGVAAEPVGKVIDGLFNATEIDEEGRPDPDPVAAMALRFRELIQVFKDKSAGDPKYRVLICVDDLDRCLPETQVAMLEAIRFLVSAGASVTFLLAIDPVLLRQSVAIHYRSNAFDADSYLDKLFHFRFSLPSMSPPSVSRLVSGLLNHSAGSEGNKTVDQVLSNFLGPLYPGIGANFSSAIPVPEVQNPRIVRKILQRLVLLADACGGREKLGLHDPHSALLLFAWLGIVERWPQVRAVFQGRGDGFAEAFMRYHEFHGAHKGGKMLEVKFTESYLANLPTRTECPALSQILEKIQPFGTEQGRMINEGKFLHNVDQVMVSAGL